MQLNDLIHASRELCEITPTPKAIVLPPQKFDAIMDSMEEYLLPPASSDRPDTAPVKNFFILGGSMRITRHPWMPEDFIGLRWPDNTHTFYKVKGEDPCACLPIQHNVD